MVNQKLSKKNLKNASRRLVVYRCQKGIRSSLSRPEPGLVALAT